MDISFTRNEANDYAELEYIQMRDKCEENKNGNSRKQRMMATLWLEPASESTWRFEPSIDINLLHEDTNLRGSSIELLISLREDTRLLYDTPQ